MKIQELCKCCKISKRNVYFYIKEGLLEPSCDEQSGRYVFTEADCTKLSLIVCLRNVDMPIPYIRSILNKPVLTSYYLTTHMNEIRRQCDRLAQTLGSMDILLQKLPIEPQLSDLKQLCMEAGITPDTTKETEDSYSINDAILANRFLLSPFSFEKNPTEYQNYLWIKINQLAAGELRKDYRKINEFLSVISPSVRDKVYAQENKRCVSITSMSQADCAAYAAKARMDICHALDTPAAVKLWNNYYESFFSVINRIYDSEIGTFMQELNPVFTSYCQNIHLICQLLYDWLCSPEGDPVLTRMKNAFPEHLDIESHYHGQLESIANLIDLCKLL